jgi:hypothetical protein
MDLSEYFLAAEAVGFLPTPVMEKYLKKSTYWLALIGRFIFTSMMISKRFSEQPTDPSIQKNNILFFLQMIGHPDGLLSGSGARKRQRHRQLSCHLYTVG